MAQNNGEAFYGSTRWKIENEGQKEMPLVGTSHRKKTRFNRSFTNQNFWFTAKENKVFRQIFLKCRINYLYNLTLVYFK
ncbi:hypothetical protein AAY42_01245 [Flagellimonas eckloniae]|uniref:Uncharacterized protein n=1 Tax=Flagellimonas eckloniae TaxID=346185 RepID=A0A0Q1BVY2_9FLAO|nr:hypothetical protein AAY42_01245 [Allomuricauda eckloniae]